MREQVLFWKHVVPFGSVRGNRDGDRRASRQLPRWRKGRDGEALCAQSKWVSRDAPIAFRQRHVTCCDSNSRLTGNVCAKENLAAIRPAGKRARNTFRRVPRVEGSGGSAGFRSHKNGLRIGIVVRKRRIATIARGHYGEAARKQTRGGIDFAVPTEREIARRVLVIRFQSDLAGGRAAPGIYVDVDFDGLAVSDEVGMHAQRGGCRRKGDRLPVVEEILTRSQLVENEVGVALAGLLPKPQSSEVTRTPNAWKDDCAICRKIIGAINCSAWPGRVTG